MAETAFDLVVIGAGPGGYVAAIRASQLGMKTAIVERENLGGICLNWGCIPTKALLRSSEIYHLLHRLDEFGFSAKDISFDVKKIVERSRKVAGRLSGGVGYPDEEAQDHRVRRHGEAEGQGRDRADGQGRQADAGSHRQEHHPRDRSPRPHAARHGTRRQADLDLSRSAWCPTPCRNRCWSSARARLAWSSPASSARSGRRHGRRSAGPHPAGRGRGGLRIRPQGLREAGHEDPHRRQGECAEARGRTASRRS